MREEIAVGLVGDRDNSVLAHQAIPRALQTAADTLGVSLRLAWLPTEGIAGEADLVGFDALWCVPASPYRNIVGALLAIRYAREMRLPFLGTCGGFQHSVLEFARNVLGWADAEHAESAPGVGRPVVSQLNCALVEVTGTVRLFPGSRIAAAYNATETFEQYHCRYGLNPAFRDALVGGPLRPCADDETGEVRAVELDDHPFFVATLFQPERAAFAREPAPLVLAFMAACIR